MFTFGAIAFTFGEITFTFGEIAFTFWGNKGFSKIFVFLEFHFCCSGGLGALWVGGPRRGFRKCLSHACIFLSPDSKYLLNSPISRAKDTDSQVGMDVADVDHRGAQSCCQSWLEVLPEIQVERNGSGDEFMVPAGEWSEHAQRKTS